MSGVGLTGEIEPLNGASFPVFSDVRGKGGWRGVTDLAARNGIPDNFRSVGMVVVTQDDGESYQLDGGIDNADWVVFGGGSAGGVPPFENTFYASPDATPATSVFNSLQDAIDAVTSGTPTMIICAPATFNENLTIPPGLDLVICLYEFGGIRGTINGSVDWNVATPDFLCIAGLDLPGGITQHDASTSNGPATLRIGNCFCDGITGTLTHAVVALDTFGEHDGDCRLSGTNHINGQVFTENTAITGPVTTPFLAMVTSALAHNVTATSMVMVSSELTSFVTLNIFSDLYLDEYSAFSARAGVILSGPGKVHLASGSSLEQVDGGTGGATPTFDFSRNSAFTFALDQDCTPIFQAPLYSQWLALHLIQGGAENFAFHWPANARGAPVVPLTGQVQYMIYWCVEDNLFYVFAQPADLSSFLTKVGGLVEGGPLVADAGTLVGNPALGGHQVNASISVSTPSSTGAIALDIGWTDTDNIARTKRLVAPLLTTAQNFDSGIAFIRSKKGVAITYEIVVVTPITGVAAQGTVEFEVVAIP